MGLGLLLAGYLFCLNFFNSYFLLPAALLMGWGLWKLAPLYLPFSTARWFCFPLGLEGVAGIVVGILGARMPEAADWDRVRAALGCLSDLTLALTLCCVLGGVYLMTREVGLPRQAAAALRNRIYTLLFYLPLALMEVLKSDSRLLLWTALIWTVLGLVVFVLNARLFLSCFRRVTMPGRETAPPREPEK